MPPKPEPAKLCEKGHRMDGDKCYACDQIAWSDAQAARAIVDTIKATIPERYIEADIKGIEPALLAVYEGLSRGQGINLWGMVGRGKTYAMAAFCKALIKQGQKCAMVDYEWFGLEIRATYQKASTLTELDITNKYIRPQVLFVDDLGVTADDKESSFSRRTFTTLLNRRVNQMKPTFITSNKSLGEIAKSFDTRVASRLAMACVSYELKGKDRRI